MKMEQKWTVSCGDGSEKRCSRNADHSLQAILKDAAGMRMRDGRWAVYAYTPHASGVSIFTAEAASGRRRDTRGRRGKPESKDSLEVRVRRGDRGAVRYRTHPNSHIGINLLTHSELVGVPRVLLPLLPALVPTLVPAALLLELAKKAQLNPSEDGGEDDNVRGCGCMAERSEKEDNAAMPLFGIGRILADPTMSINKKENLEKIKNVTIISEAYPWWAIKRYEQWHIILEASDHALRGLILTLGSLSMWAILERALQTMNALHLSVQDQLEQRHAAALGSRKKKMERHHKASGGVEPPTLPEFHEAFFQQMGIPVALPSILLTSTSKIGGNVAALSALPITDISCPALPAELIRFGLKRIPVKSRENLIKSFWNQSLIP
ncbi:hypothetical protein DFH07DRAFT_766418 [Mycena maculata]|uniref:Uncharacterized protein n=1 Tax=Mycena maculata TaxID=230809 RepID=A0AAD7K5R3_9AGAR|nr:hypothetical protein DFH07DRAFT_766418 [Mycena maculata]